MDIKIREIYNNYNQANNWNDEISKKIERKIMEEIAEVQQIMEWKEFEKYRDRIFAVSEIAKEGGSAGGGWFYSSASTEHEATSGRYEAPLF